MGAKRKKTAKKAVRVADVDLNALRAELKALKKLVLLEKTKQKLLQGKQIGPE
jgi:hypothetical protein